VRGTILVILVTAAMYGCDKAPSAPGNPAPARAVDRGDRPAVAPGAVEAALDATERYLAGGDLASARAVVERLAERAPNDPRVRETCGRVLLTVALQEQASGDGDAAVSYAGAYEHYRAATDLDPRSAGLHRSAGSVAVMAGNEQAALDHYEQAASLDLLDPQAPLFAAQLLIGSSRHEEATRHLEHVLELDPEEPAAHASLAVIAMHQQRLEAALEHIATARSIEPADPGLRAQEARIHRRAGAPQRGLELLVTLGPADRAEVPVTTEIAACYEALGDDDRAAEAWGHRYLMHEGEPGAWRAAVEAAETLIRAGQQFKAAVWVERAKLAAPDNEAVLAVQEKMRRMREQE
jgi:tetratricopeptide (TPR) repeat protein